MCACLCTDAQVYLLASVGRPSEMNYVFDALKEADQFDLLLTDELCKVSCTNIHFVYCESEKSRKPHVQHHVSIFSDNCKVNAEWVGERIYKMDQYVLKYMCKDYILFRNGSVNLSYLISSLFAIFQLGIQSV